MSYSRHKGPCPRKLCVILYIISCRINKSHDDFTPPKPKAFGQSIKPYFSLTCLDSRLSTLHEPKFLINDSVFEGEEMAHRFKTSTNIGIVSKSGRSSCLEGFMLMLSTSISFSVLFFTSISCRLSRGSRVTGREMKVIRSRFPRRGSCEHFSRKVRYRGFVLNSRR